MVCSMDELARMDTIDQAALVRSGELTPVELVEAAIARIEQQNPQVNAVIHKMYDKALAEAGSPDLANGPFRGVPMLLKDLWPASAGDPFHQGVKGLKAAGHTSEVDSHLVRRYRQAGFVILGRTNTPELGLMATTEPQAYGPSHNPWNLDRGPGGSSGGASAAVASGMVPAANASDGGGSIRIPAAMCGLVGLKPSRGRVPMGPMQDEWSQSVQHVVSHSVRDTAAILDISARPTLGDGVVAPEVGRPWATTSLQDPGSLRIGYMSHCPRPGYEVDPEIAQATVAAAALLADMGHRVDEDHPEVIDQPEWQQQFGATWAAAAPVTLERLGDLIGRPVTADDVEPGTWAMAQAGAAVTGAQVIKAQQAQHTHRRLMASWWESGFDILVTPTCAQTAPVLGDLTPTDDEPMRGGKGSIPYALYTSMFNSTGQPAISLPLGHSSEGLPIGIQFVAAYGREDLLLQLAHQLEQEVQWANNRAPMHL